MNIPNPSFSDHFSKQSDAYVRGRPSYPPEFIEYLKGLAPKTKLAWDVATGNGQAAVMLAQYFDHVYASDASAEQIKRAAPHKSVSYHVEPAEKTALKDNSVDLVTVAVGVHWFDHDKFYAEVKRMLKPDGVIAVWMYYYDEIDGETENIVEEFRSKFLKDYWPEKFNFVINRYENLPFPFERIQIPEFRMKTVWRLQNLLDFLRSWSGTQRYIDIHGEDPVNIVEPKLRAFWSNPEEEKVVKWKLYVKVGRK